MGGDRPNSQVRAVSFSLVYVRPLACGCQPTNKRHGRRVGYPLSVPSPGAGHRILGGSLKKQGVGKKADPLSESRSPLRREYRVSRTEY